jgi:3-deoxy-D-manno-octulosonic-acid transferase
MPTKNKVFTLQTSDEVLIDLISNLVASNPELEFTITTTTKNGTHTLNEVVYDREDSFPI